MLAGRFPYENIQLSDVDTRLAAGKRALIDRLYVLPPYVPSNVRRLVGSLVGVDPAGRPDTARSALRMLNELQYVDWRRTSGAGLLGEWVGTWPPNKIPARRRHYRVQAVEMARGPSRRRVRPTAGWQKPGGNWRGIGKLARHTDTGDAKALAQFFRQVELVAQASPA
jgi:hypothetical protein